MPVFSSNTKSYFNDTLIQKRSNIHTYSHAFHIKSNYYKYIDYIPLYSKVLLKVDTYLNRKKNGTIKLLSPILGFFEENTKISGIFIFNKNEDNLSSNFSSQSTMNRHLKKVLAQICEKLPIMCQVYDYCNYYILKKSISFEKTREPYDLIGYKKNLLSDFYKKISSIILLKYLKEKLS